MLVELGVVEQRYRAVLEVLEEGISVTEAARRHGVARQTVHEWLRRYAQEGLGGLADRSARPASCPHQMAAVTEARITGMRREHPGWGSSRIRWELKRAGGGAAAGPVGGVPGAGAPWPGGRAGGAGGWRITGGGSGRGRWTCGRWT